MTDIVPAHQNTTDSWVAVVADVAQLAQHVARTPFVPKAMAGNPAAVAAAILTGRELGLGPMTSLRGIDVIEGKPSLTAQMLAARILAAGHSIRWGSVTDQKVTVTIERGDGLSEATVTWTMQDATRAGLAAKKVWQQYPRAMLRSRAISEAAALACPDVALGLEVDVQPDPDRGGETTTVRVTRLAPETPHEPVQASEPETGTDTPPDPPDAVEAVLVAPAPPEPAITPAQLRMIGALIGKWEELERRTLDRAERRRFIAFCAGVDDPDTLASAKDLTKVQGTAAIDQLRAHIEAAEQDDGQQEIPVEDPPQ